MNEIERKFLVKDSSFLENLNGQRLTQAYLSKDPERSVRIRIKGEHGFITIKGISNSSGLSRYEWEKEIAVTEAQELLKLALPGSIDKTRYEVQVVDHLWEIDVFHGENEGLMIVEIELTHEAETLDLPDWCGKEVTGDRRYYNTFLSEHPFKDW